MSNQHAKTATLNMNRRELLLNSAAAAGAIAIGGTLLMSASKANASSMHQGILSSMSNARQSCVERHSQMAQELAALKADEFADAHSVIHAIKTSHCPDCGTHITNTQILA